MLKLQISGTKNELKSFRKWLLRATKILPKYQINDDPVFKCPLLKNKTTKKFFVSTFLDCYNL